MGAEKKRMRVRMAGGAKMLNDQGLFDIGRRNHAAIRKIMWQNGMFIDAEHVGGTYPRNMQLNISDGSLLIKCNEQTFTL
jgi:chemotaxis protein CheD